MELENWIIPITRPFYYPSTTYGAFKKKQFTKYGVVHFYFICHDRNPHHLGSNLNVRVFFYVLFVICLTNILKINTFIPYIF